MASLASLQFLIEPKAESSLLHYCTNRRQPRLGSFGSRPRRSPVPLRLRGLACGCSGSRAAEDGSLKCSFCCGGMLGMYDRGQFLSVRAAGRGPAEGDDVDNVETEDKFQATIEKSKRVLAMQRDLMNQVICSMGNSRSVPVSTSSRKTVNILGLVGIRLEFH